MIWKNNVLVTPGRPDRRDSVVEGMRVFPPERSKLSAFFYCGGKIELNSRMKVLYLGAASGTTVSYLADYVEVVYAVEFAPEPIEKLIKLSEKRDNIIPIFDDARYPENYRVIVEEVDLICQDIAQRDQAAIFSENLSFLKMEGLGLLMLKTRSVSAVMSVEDIILNECKILEKNGLGDFTEYNLKPYYPAHIAITCRKMKI